MAAPKTWKQEGFAYAVLSALPALIVVIDSQGDIVAANSEWGEAARAAGSPDLVETTIGQNYRDICRQGAAAGAPSAQETLEGLEAVLHSASPLFTLEYPCPVQDETRWYLLYATPLAGQECGAVVAHINITERKQLEQQLRRSTQEMSDFLNMVGHELRSPLTSIRGHLQLIERRLHRLISSESPYETMLDDALACQVAPLLDSLERAEAQAGRLNRLIEDMVEVARIQAHQLKLISVQADLVEVLCGVVAELRLAWPPRALVLDVPDHAVMVKMDVGRIEQVVINYVTNALKYSPANRPITVSLGVDKQQALVRVQDEGPGLAAEELAHIWERFYRVRGVEALEGTSGGLGLGLSICRSIVQQHGGQVGVESTPGKGSTFWFSLPLQTPLSSRRSE